VEKYLEVNAKMNIIALKTITKILRWQEYNWSTVREKLEGLEL
jgi:hypothetical protein